MRGGAARLRELGEAGELGQTVLRLCLGPCWRVELDRERSTATHGPGWSKQTNSSKQTSPVTGNDNPRTLRGCVTLDLDESRFCRERTNACFIYKGFQWLWSLSGCVSQAKYSVWVCALTGQGDRTRLFVQRFLGTWEEKKKKHWKKGAIGKIED